LFPNVGKGLTNKIALCPELQYNCRVQVAK
jgi:hypothetical protein